MLNGGLHLDGLDVQRERLESCGPGAAGLVGTGRIIQTLDDLKEDSSGEAVISIYNKLRMVG